MSIDLPLFPGALLQIDFFPNLFLVGVSNWDGWQQCDCGECEPRLTNVTQLGLLFFSINLFIDK
jgi:hypothetical protein